MILEVDKKNRFEGPWFKHNVPQTDSIIFLWLDCTGFGTLVHKYAETNMLDRDCLMGRCTKIEMKAKRSCCSPSVGIRYSIKDWRECYWALTKWKGFVHRIISLVCCSLCHYLFSYYWIFRTILNLKLLNKFTKNVTFWLQIKKCMGKIFIPDNFGRLFGSLSANSYQAITSEVPQIHVWKEAVPVQITPFWIGLNTQSVHQG